MALATCVTTYAAISCFQWRQTITQEVGYAFENVVVTNYSLPKGYVGFSEFSDEPSALSFTTKKPDLRLIITCTNTEVLQTKYETLTLTLMSGTTPLPTMNLLNATSKINYTLSSVTTYAFGYRFNYLPNATSISNEILLNVTFSLP